MYEYIKGHLVEFSPTYAIVENNDIGYFINISVNTSTTLKKGQECQLYLHQVIREDAQLLFGFIDKKERELFRLLISVSGIGPNTARLVLSSVCSYDLAEAILKNNLALLQSIKGIGSKTAQRIIIELRDKIADISIENDQKVLLSDNTLQKDALVALTMLGFSKTAVEKVLNKLVKENNDLSLEEIVKQALNYL